MTRPHHPNRRSPRRRDDTTHPTPTRPRGRRAVERRPWPTAPTTTRPSPGKPTSGTNHPRSQGSAPTPTPATVWTAGTLPIDLDTAWPAQLVEKIVSSFSRPGEQVVLLPWPTTDEPRPRPAPVGADGVIDHAPDTEPNPGLADAVRTVERLDRGVRVEHVPDASATTAPAPRSLRADLDGNTGRACVTAPTTPPDCVEADPRHHTTTPIGSADLVVTTLHPRHNRDSGADRVALFAARLLRVGGILAVLTHCDWTTGELTDPTGAVVTAGQNADLLYLQHIVAVHAPVRDGRFHLPDTHPDHHPDGSPDRADTGAPQTRARHRALVRGLPEPHRRIHSDVLVLVQPHDHQPPTDTPSRTGDLR
ncbi:MAG: hypothetical protein HOV94_36730 [Saccharothrix sp.]|nr:hypothetical protein [Saccharothrix sp.]